MRVWIGLRRIAAAFRSLPGHKWDTFETGSFLKVRLPCHPAVLLRDPLSVSTPESDHVRRKLSCQFSCPRAREMRAEMTLAFVGERRMLAEDGCRGFGEVVQVNL